MSIEITNYPTDRNRKYNFTRVHEYLLTLQSGTDRPPINAVYNNSIVFYMSDGRTAFLETYDESISLSTFVTGGGGTTSRTDFGISLFSKVAVTDYGLALKDAYGGSIFMSKTDNDNWALCGTALRSTSSSSIFFKIEIDADNSRGLRGLNQSYEGYTNLLNGNRMVMDKTLIHPIVFDCGSYTPNLMYVPFTQRNITNGEWEVVTINGTKYLYDGLYALKV